MNLKELQDEMRRQYGPWEVKEAEWGCGVTPDDKARKSFLFVALKHALMHCVVLANHCGLSLEEVGKAVVEDDARIKRLVREYEVEKQTRLFDF